MPSEDEKRRERGQPVGLFRYQLGVVACTAVGGPPPKLVDGRELGTWMGAVKPHIRTFDQVAINWRRGTL